MGRPRTGSPPATAQGFERGTTTLGVSVQPVTTNSVPFDRETYTLFPQINALGIRGEHEGEGESYAVGELPLEPVMAVAAFFFAWYAFYPGSEFV